MSLVTAASTATIAATLAATSVASSSSASANSSSTGDGAFASVLNAADQSSVPGDSDATAAADGDSTAHQERVPPTEPAAGASAATPATTAPSDDIEIDTEERPDVDADGDADADADVAVGAALVAGAAPDLVAGNGAQPASSEHAAVVQTSAFASQLHDPVPTIVDPATVDPATVNPPAVDPAAVDPLGVDPLGVGPATAPSATERGVPAPAGAVGTPATEAATSAVGTTAPDAVKADVATSATAVGANVTVATGAPTAGTATATATTTATTNATTATATAANAESATDTAAATATPATTPADGSLAPDSSDPTMRADTVRPAVEVAAPAAPAVADRQAPTSGSTPISPSTVSTGTGPGVPVTTTLPFAGADVAAWRHLRAGSTSTMSMDVETDTLGPLRIAASELDGALKLSLLSDDALSRNLLADRLPELRRDLTDAGIDFADLDVADRSAGQRHGESSDRTDRSGRAPNSASVDVPNRQPSAISSPLTVSAGHLDLRL